MMKQVVSSQGLVVRDEQVVGDNGLGIRGVSKQRLGFRGMLSPNPYLLSPNSLSALVPIYYLLTTKHGGI